MSDEIIEGQLQPPKPTGDTAVLAAFREVTDWTDEDVLHYAECTMCDPIGEEPYWCRDSPREKRFWHEHEAAKASRGEPVRPQAPLPAALRRIGEQIVQDAKARVPYARGGIVHGTAGGPYCGVCGAPIDLVPIPAYPGDTTTIPGSCPNGCDPTAARPTTEPCSNCERCTWNPGPDCGRPEHPHCPTCGHCNGRHYADKDWPTGPPDMKDDEHQAW